MSDKPERTDEQVIERRWPRLSITDYVYIEWAVIAALIGIGIIIGVAT